VRTTEEQVWKFLSRWAAGTPFRIAAAPCLLWKVLDSSYERWKYH